MVEKLVLLLIIFLICGFGLFLYHYKWQALYRDLGIDKVKDAVEEAMQEEKQAEQEKVKNADMPFYVRYWLPILFLVLFIVEMAAVRYFPQSGMDDKTPVLIAAFAIVIPFILVLIVLMKESKSAKSKFVLSLVFALVMELVAAGSMVRMLDGYYFESAYGFKRLGNFALTMAITAGAMYTAHTNWLKVYAGKTKADDIHE